MVLKKGMKGAEVVNLQKNLNQLGYNLGVDGDFGGKTEAAIIAFQEAHGLKVDGIVGPYTQAAIATALVGQVSPAPMGSSMPWIEWMRSHIGEHEIAGSKHNPFIVAMFKYTTYKTDSDETPWCAAAVCTALEETGFKSTRDASAISYASYGVPCALIPGCVVVIRRADGGHHVTFCDHVIDSRSFAGLGGNQSDSLKISTYQRGNIVATRWPVKKDGKPAPMNILAESEEQPVVTESVKVKAKKA